MVADSFMEANEKKKKMRVIENKEHVDEMLKFKEDFKKFRDLCNSDYWKECVKFIKDEIYQGLAINPGEPGVGDWWAKYVWGLKCFIERCEAHAKKYDEAIIELSK